jgi:hypothetical protein
VTNCPLPLVAGCGGGRQTEGERVTVRDVRLEGGHAGLLLETDAIAVTILPDKGCDVYSIIDPQSGVDVLFKSPWGLLPESGLYDPNSPGHWLRRYPGGWQVILPNGGAPSEPYGTAWGFHGEACLIPWEVEPRGDRVLAARTELFYAPLAVEREMEVDGPSLRIRETVTNLGRDSLDFMWGHHPAFGAPFLEEGCLVSVGARAYTADDEAPGTLVAAGSVHAWPIVETADGENLDLSVVPGPDEIRDHLGYLTDFESPYFAITNPRLGLGAAVRWTPGILDSAWFWQEVHSSSGFPWFRRAYVTAVEPNSTIPAQGVEKAREKGGELVTLDSGEGTTVELTFVLFRGGGYVADVRADGEVVLED